MSEASTFQARWRTFADAVAVALGINVWVSLVFLPAIFVGGLSGGLQQALTILPLPILFLGVLRRNEVLLLFGFPSALLVPVAATPEMAMLPVYGPTRFAIVSPGLVAFLFGASVFTSFYEPPPPNRVRPLRSAAGPIPARWLRRNRMYAALAIIAAAFPTLLLYHINFDSAGAELLSTSYPGRAASFATLLNITAIATWLLLFSSYILGPLKLHRTGDRNLQQGLAELRSIQRGRPRAYFYLFAVVALILMALLFLANT